MTLSPFRASAAAPNRRPEATQQFKLDLDKAIDEARHWHVDPRTLADIIDQRREALLMQFATTAAIG
jgi:hypothetical protein